MFMTNILQLILCLLFFSYISLISAHDGDLDFKDCYNYRKIGEYYCHKKKQDIYREKKQLVENKKKILENIIENRLSINLIQLIQI